MWLCVVQAHLKAGKGRHRRWHSTVLGRIGQDRRNRGCELEMLGM